MKVRDVREAIDGLDDDVEVSLRVENIDEVDSCLEVGFDLVLAGRCIGPRPDLVILATVFDATATRKGDG